MEHAAGQYEIGQGEEGLEMRGSFGQASVAHFAVAKEVLDDDLEP